MSFPSGARRGDRSEYGGKACIFNGHAWHSVYPHNRRKLYTLNSKTHHRCGDEHRGWPRLPDDDDARATAAIRGG